MGSEGKTLLLVEDDAIIGLSESAILRREGYDVIHVGSGEAALETVASGTAIDLILMDINLGQGMDGTEAAQGILAIRDIPIVFLSSHTEKEVVLKTEGISSYGYIVKNSGPTVLFTSIRMAFRLHEARTRLEASIAEQGRVEAALSQRLVALTQPLEGGGEGLRFDDLFAREEIQAIQDAFAQATGVASIITRADGTPITRPSSFRRICSDFVRSSPEGLRRCLESDSVIAGDLGGGPKLQPCLSAGLWDGGTSISVGDRIIAKWLIGQVRDEDTDLDALEAYADVLGVDRREYRKALEEVPFMSRARFEEICQALSLIAHQLSKVAYQNVQQARYISESRAASEVLRASEASLRRAEAAAGIGSWTLDLKSRIMTASEGAVRLYGVAEGKDLLENIQKVPLPEYRPILDQALAALLDRGQAYDVTFRIKRPNDGAILDIRSTAEFDPASAKVFGIIRDITEAVKDTQRIKESEAHFREIFQNASIPLLEEDFSGAKQRLDELGREGMVDLDNWLGTHPEEIHGLIGRVKLLRVNKAYCELLGIDTSRGMGGAISVLPTVVPERLRREFVHFHRGALTYTEALVLSRPGKPDLSLKLLLSIPPEHATDWSRVFVSFIDMTNERNQEMRLEGLLRDKETLMKELEHRVKNSMALISSLFDLESERLPDEATRQVFQDAQERVRTVSSIYDLLSRSTGSESLDSKAQVGELVRLIRETYLGDRENIEIALDVESQPIPIKQGVAISLIINELLTNALKYAFSPGQAGRIDLGFRRAGQAYVVTVADNGKGLPPGFEPGKGDRLGFKLVEMLSSQYGGSMAASSGPGLRVEVRIPLMVPAPEKG